MAHTVPGMVSSHLEKERKIIVPADFVSPEAMSVVFNALVEAGMIIDENGSNCYPVRRYLQTDVKDTPEFHLARAGHLLRHRFNVEGIGPEYLNKMKPGTAEYTVKLNDMTEGEICARFEDAMPVLHDNARALRRFARGSDHAQMAFNEAAKQGENFSINRIQTIKPFITERHHLEIIVTQDHIRAAGVIIPPLRGPLIHSLCFDKVHYYNRGEKVYAYYHVDNRHEWEIELKDLHDPNEGSKLISQSDISEEVAFRVIDNVVLPVMMRAMGDHWDRVRPAMNSKGGQAYSGYNHPALKHIALAA